MPARISPGTFLSLLRNARTGEIDYNQLERNAERAAKTDDPQDCVRHSPSIDPDWTQMTGYDIHGVVRVKIEIAERDAGWFEGLMLRYMRWRFGRPIRLLR